MTFFHIPSNRVVHNPSPRRVRAYRRSSNFVELTPHEDPMQSFVLPSDSTKPDSVVPEGTVKEILSWVDGDEARALQAIEAERAGNGRVTLIAALRKILSD